MVQNEIDVWSIFKRLRAIIDFFGALCVSIIEFPIQSWIAAASRALLSPGLFGSFTRGTFCVHDQ
jgi:hypothetical protein